MTLSRDDIVEALRALAASLPEGERHELVIAGGAALVLLYGARESTHDVDAVAADAETLAAARRVAVERGLPADWLNDAAKGYLHGLSRGAEVLAAPNLIVRAVAIEQLLAMKLSAWRDDVDIEDARLLLSHLEGSADEVWEKVARHLVPGRELKGRYAFDDLWEAERGPS